jgi:hypothetical protein
MLGRIADAKMMHARMYDAGSDMTISQLKKFLRTSGRTLISISKPVVSLACPNEG